MNDKLSENPGRLASRLLPHYGNVELYKAVDDPAKLLVENHITPDSLIKLDANENPFGTTNSVSNLFATRSDISIYPDAEQSVLRDALSKYTKIEKDQIVAGAGSDELIDLITRLFVSPGDSVMISRPTFGMYSFSASVSGADVIDVPRNINDFSLDLDGILNHINEVKLVFISSPNNPTGNVTDLKDLKQILNTGVPLVVDEAYVEFSDRDCTELLDEYPNLMILRTFSKWAGLAGLRVGYGLFPKDVAKILMRIKPPYSVGTLAQTAATTALQNMPESDQQINTIISERSKVWSSLRGMPKLKVYPSEGNFFLVKILNTNAKDVKSKLLERGISVRYFDDNLLEDCLRISIGLPDQNIKLLKELESLI